MPLFRVLAIALLVCGPVPNALAAPDAQPASSLSLSLKVCLVGAALSTALERLRFGPNTRKPQSQPALGLTLQKQARSLSSK